MARKPLIAPGSILPAQDESPGGLLSRIVAKDRARRTGEDVPETAAESTVTQEAVNTEIQEAINQGGREYGNPGTRKPVDTGEKEGRSDAAAGARASARNTGRQEDRKTGPRGQGGAPARDTGPDDSAEPTDKATFDLPRSLHQRLKVQAAMERRPARAIVIELLTRYLDEHPLF